MAALLLTLFCYLGWVLYGVFLWFAAGSSTAPRGQGSRLGRIAGVSLAFGALVGVLATLTAAKPPEAPEYHLSFVGNGMLGFPQAIFLCVCAALVILALRRAWWGLLVAPAALILSFALTWWALTFVIPPAPTPSCPTSGPCASAGMGWSLLASILA